MVQVHTSQRGVDEMTGCNLSPTVKGVCRANADSVQRDSKADRKAPTTGRRTERTTERAERPNPTHGPTPSPKSEVETATK